MVDQMDYRLAFILPETGQLLGMQCSGPPEFPRIRIPMWRRTAEMLTRTIEERWSVKTLVLDILPSASLTPCAVIEVRSPAWEFTNAGLMAVALNSISTLSLTSEERASLHSLMEGKDASRGAFSRIGWIEEAQSWIQAAVKGLEISSTDEMLQLNGGGEFCLLRLRTQSGSAYWLKAVGGPNKHEYGITTYLAMHYASYLPRIMAAREDWNAWVMEDCGPSLQSSASLADFEQAVARLSCLQKKLIGRTEDLLAVHCGDHRLGTLRKHIDEIIGYLNEAMCLQVSTKAPKLSGPRLREIGSVLHLACEAMQALEIPDSLMHSDISPGSILKNGRDCVFTDWCEAYIGNPFITLEQLCVHATRNTETPGPWVRSLRRVYRSCWLDILTEQQIDRAFTLVPIISVLSYLYGRGNWLRSSQRYEPAFLSYSRGLARHMDRIAASHDLQEALCRPN
jgi:hypothetical protein